MKYICNNEQFGILKEKCGRVWSSEDWNKDIDTEYTRNEKCSKCGGKDITKVENN